MNFGTTPTEIVLTVQRFFCPKCRNTHIQHIAVRKDEMERLYKEGNTEAASKLKHSRYILVSSRETLQKKDEKAEKEQAVKQKEFLFKKKKKKLKGGNEEKYNALIKENQLLLTIDLIKEKLKLAYKLTDETEMEAEITEIIDLCE